MKRIPLPGGQRDLLRQIVALWVAVTVTILSGAAVAAVLSPTIRNPSQTLAVALLLTAPLGLFAWVGISGVLRNPGGEGGRRLFPKVFVGMALVLNGIALIAALATTRGTGLSAEKEPSLAFLGLIGGFLTTVLANYFVSVNVHELYQLASRGLVAGGKKRLVFVLETIRAYLAHETIEPISENR